MKNCKPYLANNFHYATPFSGITLCVYQDPLSYGPRGNSATRNDTEGRSNGELFELGVAEEGPKNTRQVYSACPIGDTVANGRHSATYMLIISK